VRRRFTDLRTVRIDDDQKRKLAIVVDVTR